MVKSGKMTRLEVSEVKAKLSTQQYKSKYAFINATSGLRQGELSTIIAQYGNGKSTLIRSIVQELLIQGCKTLLSLSEEDTDFYNMPIWERMYDVCRQSEDLTNSAMENLFLESHVTMKKEEKNLNKFISLMEDKISTYDINLIILDNFTTSFFGRSSIEIQALAVEMLKELAVKYYIPIICVFHTAKGTDIYKKIITGEDVRGNATSANVGSYNYVLSNFLMADVPRTFLVVDKARYHSKANKKVFELFFDDQTKLFKRDEQTSFDEMRKVQSSTNKKSRTSV